MAYISQHTGAEIDNNISINSTQNNRLDNLENNLSNLIQEIENINSIIQNIEMIKLNYNIISYSNKSNLLNSKPNTNTIGIITTQTITTWQIGGEKNNNPINGELWVETGNSQITNAIPGLKLGNNTFNTINPIRAYQYFNNTWNNIDGYLYTNNQWNTFNVIPIFTYTGNYEIVDDNNSPISASTKNWKIRFLTSGILSFSNLGNASEGIDVFLVGGGGGAKSWDSSYSGPSGGGGYTTTMLNYTSLNTVNSYEIIIGSGGTGSTGYSAGSTNGTQSSAFGAAAAGGKGLSAGQVYNGAAGGSGGASLSYKDNPVIGGTDGSIGGASSTSWIGGVGQGTTTREFGEVSGMLYASGGNTLNASVGTNGIANTGNGGNGCHTGKGGNGGTGIVVIRNSRNTIS